jgi:ATP-dependent helicase HrpA
MPDGEELLTASKSEKRPWRDSFTVEAADGSELARGENLPALQDRFAASARAAVAGAVAGDLERTGLRDWPDDLAEIPRVIEHVVAGRVVRGHPAFVDVGTSVDLRVFATAAEAAAAMPAGIRRLLRCSSASPVKNVERQLDPRARLALKANPDGSLTALIDDCADAAADALVDEPVWTRDAFAALRAAAGNALVPMTLDVLGRVEKLLAAARDVDLLVPAQPVVAQQDAIADIRDQLARLLAPGFVAAAGRARLADLTRYAAAIRRRLEQLPHGIAADRQRMAQVHAVQDAYDDLLAALPEIRRVAADVRDIGWQIEELRVSLWAQQLGTPRPVSEKRIYRAIDTAG